MKKALFVLAFCMLLFTNVRASHFSGGEVRYEFNGTNYTVYVTLYKVCDWASASLPTVANVNFKSVSTSKNFNCSLPLIMFDTVNISCGSGTSTCVSSSATVPGYIAGYFKDTVSLPVATDWVISYTDGVRINTLSNLALGSGTMYLQTTLNNVSAINSNPLIASTPTYYMTVSNAISVPLQAIDPEGDSLVYQIVTPMDAASTPSTYAAGYSLASPFGGGGTCSLGTGNVLNLMSATTGKFAIAYRVYEYRNSILVGAYNREFVVVVLPGTGALTFPKPTSTSVFTTYTCPGASNSVTLSFTDPTVTDSVYLTVIPPVMSGWTFSSTSSNALGGATTTITWTTPSGMNPATLPHFFIKVRARDNGCPNASSDYALVVRTRQCLADSVWPGDANGDFTVNIYDPLAIAIATGQTGAARISPTTAWVAQACTPWSTVFVTNNTNMKHADCDGNGTVNSTDLAAVSSNYGAFHLKGGGSLPKTTAGQPDLYLDVTGISFIAGTTVSVPLKLGSSTAPMNNLYGVATRISVSGVTLTTPPTANTAISWMGSSSSLINFAKPVSNNTLDMVVAKQDQSMVSGQGTIAMVNIAIPAGTPSGTNIQMDIDYNITRLIDNKGIPITKFNFPGTPAKGVVIAAAVNQINSNITNAFIVPNPASTNADLNLNVKTNCEAIIDIIDITGKRVWQSKLQLNAGKTYMPLPVKELHSGMYSVRVSTAENNEPTILKWIVQ